MNKFDVLVIGGGASGMMAAISAARYAPDIRVAIVEGTQRVGKKLLTTGNGRCNITNISISGERYHSRNIEAVMSIIDRFGLDETAEFFMSMGVPFRTDESGKVYPYSLQASSVVDALRFECERLGVEVLPENKVEAILPDGTVKAAQGQLTAKAIVIACGGKSAAKTGSDGSGFELLKSLGHSLVKPYPALTPVKTETQFLRAVKGVKVDCKVTAVVNGKEKTECGEVLFTDYGLSGPPILQLSGFIGESEACEAVFKLDLLADKSKDWLFGYIMKQRDRVYGDIAENLFLGLLNKRVGIAVIKYCSMNVNDSCRKFEKRDVAALVDAVKNFEVKITGTCGYDSAQVTGGGVPLSEFDERLRSLKNSRVLACGEVLDVYGDCGGYNLQWAWSSGYQAGISAAQIARENS